MGDDDFFSFLLSHRILPLHTMEYILGFGGQLVDLLTQLIQEMKKEELLGGYTEDHVTYELSQLCAQVYLYKGYILQDRYKYQLENRHPYLLMEHDFRGTAEEIFHALPAFHQGTDLDKKILWEWLQLIEYMAENGGQHMRIGLDLTSGFLVFSRMATIFKNGIWNTIVLLPLKPMIVLGIMICWLPITRFIRRNRPQFII